MGRTTQTVLGNNQVIFKRVNKNQAGHLLNLHALALP